MTHKTFISILVWVLGMLGYFMVMEMLAIFWKGCPWYTLSRTSWHIERSWWPFQFVFLFGLCVLMVHIFQGGIIKLAVFAPKQAYNRIRGREQT